MLRFMDEKLLNLGPLKSLAGIWEGDKGLDVAPTDDRQGAERNAFRERLVLDPMLLPVHNHEQTLFGLRYSMTAWEGAAADPFHEELGYWLWDPTAGHVMRCFLIPRGVTILAGGEAKADAKQFTLRAQLGSPTFGISSNPFLDREFKTLSFSMSVTVHDAQSFSYEQTTELLMKGRREPFLHTDRNTLRRIS